MCKMRLDQDKEELLQSVGFPIEWAAMTIDSPSQFGVLTQALEIRCWLFAETEWDPQNMACDV